MTSQIDRKRRPPWTPDKVRQRIRTTKIITRLQLFIRGKVEMSAPQVTAALGLLKKTVPDLAAVEVNVQGTIEVYDVTDKPMSAEDWAAEAAKHAMLDPPPEAIN